METFLRLGLSNAAAAAVLALVVALVALPFRKRRPAVVHALWLLVLLKLLTPPLWTVRLPIPLAPRAQAPVSQPEVAADVTSSFAELPSDRVDDFELVVDPPLPTPPSPSVPDFRLASVPWAIGVTWISGSVACLSLVVIRCRRFSNLLRHAIPAPPAVVDRVATLSSRLGVRRPPGVWLVPGAVCPMLWALFRRPRLLLPADLWADLDGPQRDTLVAHELAHLRRRDHWVRLVEVAATVLYWWHPAAWWARRALREAEEQCCDAWVVGSLPRCARQYMSAILKAVDHLSDAARSAGPWRGAAVPPAASGMASGQFRHLERRLSMIRQNEQSGRPVAAGALGRAGRVALCAGALALLPLAPSLAQQAYEVVTVQPEERGEGGEKVPLVVEVDAARAEPVPDSVSVELAAPERRVIVKAAPEGAKDVPTSITFDGGQFALTQAVEGEKARYDVQRARADVERLTAELEVAKVRLKLLEASAAAAPGERFEGTAGPKAKIKAKLAPAKVKNKLDGKGPTLFYSDRPAPAKDAPQSKDSQRRLDELEQKLDRLLDEVQDLKERGHNRTDVTTPPVLQRR